MSLILSTVSRSASVTFCVSAWGLAAGWQREIGFFDIGMAVVTLRAFRSNDLEFQRSVALALIILTDMLVETKLGIVIKVALLSLPGRAVVDAILEDLARLEG